MASKVSGVRAAVDPEPKNHFDADSGRSIEKSRDFFWDQVSIYTASGMLLIAALDIITSFTSDPVKCHGPDGFTRDQSAFMNGYCSEKTPKTDYFLFYIIGQAIVLVGPHFLWQSWFSGRLTHFITVALSLKLHREDDTGDYVQDNFSKVQSLRKSFGKSITIHWLYFAKLIMQLLFCAGACVCSCLPFYELEYTTIFHPVFHCHYTGPVTDFLELEDYMFNVTCVVPALRSHFAVWITNYILLGGNAICLCFAVVWWVIPHSVLNWKEASMFSMQSGIEPHHYSKRCSFSYTMKTDLDFLLLRLYGQDEGHGTVMREILIISTMKDLMHKAKENLNLMKEAKKDQLSKQQGRGLG